MSGGSLNYAYTNLNDAIDEIKRRAQTPLHRAFARHLEKVSNALHDLEWMFSGDTADGDEIPAINAVLGKGAVSVLEKLIEDAKKIRQELKEQIDAGKHDS